MKKSILFLVNGFGIEQGDSYNVYSPEIMPNLDRLTREKIFFSIPNTCLDYKDAYRAMSMGISEPLTYSLMENNVFSVEYQKNELLKYIENMANKNNSNIHIFCYWESQKIVNQLSAYVKEIQSKIKGKIFLHFVLCQKSIKDYKDIDRGLGTLNYEFGANVKIGIITGEDNLFELLPAKEIVKSYVTEVGEKWKDISKKLDVFVQTKIPPNKSKIFMVNYGCRLEEKDQILFFNYSNVDINKFKEELGIQRYRKLDLSTLGFYSLFPIKCNDKIPFMYNYALSSTYALNGLKNAKVNCLIMDGKDKCPYINYYLTGLRNTVDESLKYFSTDNIDMCDPAVVLGAIHKHSDKELLIINCDILNCKNLEDMKDRLSKIDKVIVELERFVNANNYNLIISSLYGLETELYNAKAEKCKINFYSKVPVVIVDNEFSLSNFSVEEGGIFELFNTILFLINQEYTDTGLLKKKSKLFSFLYKKKKVEKKETLDTVTNENNEKAIIKPAEGENKNEQETNV